MQDLKSSRWRLSPKWCPAFQLSSTFSDFLAGSTETERGYVLYTIALVVITIHFSSALCFLVQQWLVFMDKISLVVVSSWEVV